MTYAKCFELLGADGLLSYEAGIFFNIILHSMKLVIALPVPLILPIFKNILLTIRPIWIKIE